MVELIPKKAQKPSGWINTIFYLILLLTVISVTLYFVLNNVVSRTTAALEEVRDSISKEETPQNKKFESEVKKYQEKINNFSKVIKEHTMSSRIFEFLEKRCHPWVWFSKFTIDIEKSTVNLVGSANTFEILGQQIIIFKQDSTVEKVDLNNVGIEKDGRISFSLTLTINKDVFKLEQQLKQ